MNMSAQIQKADECFKALIIADDFFKNKEYEKARDRYKIVLERNPKDSYAKRQHDECVRIIQSETPLPIPSEEPPLSYSPMSWFQEGMKNSNAGNYLEAIRCYRNALDMNPNMGNAWYNLGIAYERKRKKSEAMDCYLKAAQLGHKEAQTHLLQLQKDNGGVTDTNANEQKSITPVYSAMSWFQEGIKHSLQATIQKQYVATIMLLI